MSLKVTIYDTGEAYSTTRKAREEYARQLREIADEITRTSWEGEKPIRDVNGNRSGSFTIELGSQWANDATEEAANLMDNQEDYYRVALTAADAEELAELLQDELPDADEIDWQELYDHLHDE